MFKSILTHADMDVFTQNERGQVEVWSEKCLPPGTVHLRLPRSALVAKRLEIDFAPAMVGFDFRNARCVPMFDGIVVCREFKDAILEVKLIFAHQMHFIRAITYIVSLVNSHRISVPKLNYSHGIMILSS